MAINIDENFDRYCRHMQQLAADKASALAGSGPRPWMMPPLESGWSGQLSPPTEIHAGFQTDDVEERLAAEVTADSSDMSTRQLAAAMYQIEYMKRAKRAFHARHGSTYPRIRAHAAARSKEHASQIGAYGTAVNYVNDLLKAAPS